MKYLRLHNVSIIDFFFIKIGSKTYMLERKKIKSRCLRVMEFFLLRYRITNVPNNLHKNKNICNHIIIKNIFGAQNIGSICVIKELLNKGNVSFIFKSDWK